MWGRKYSHEGLSWEEYGDLMRLIPSAPPPSNFQPNYNIAPTHEVPVCIAEEGERRLELLRRELVPHWAKEAKVGYKMINARAETLTEKPSFKPLLKSRRAIVAVSGFYEWKREGKDKQAHTIEHASGKPMMMAALWAENSALDMRSYTVITTAASDAMAPVHHRMPAILEKDQVDGWNLYLKFAGESLDDLVLTSFTET